MIMRWHFKSAAHKRQRVPHDSAQMAAHASLWCGGVGVRIGFTVRPHVGNARRGHVTVSAHLHTQQSCALVTHCGRLQGRPCTGCARRVALAVRQRRPYVYRQHGLCRPADLLEQANRMVSCDTDAPCCGWLMSVVLRVVACHALGLISNPRAVRDGPLHCTASTQLHRYFNYARAPSRQQGFRFRERNAGKRCDDLLHEVHETNAHNSSP